MAAGLTEHVWRVRDVVRSRVPPWPPPQAVDGMRQDADGARERHTSVPTLTWRAACGPDHRLRWEMIGWFTSPGQLWQGPQCVSAAYRDTINACW